MWLLLIVAAKLVYSEEKQVIESIDDWKGTPSVCKYSSSRLVLGKNMSL